MGTITYLISLVTLVVATVTAAATIWYTKYTRDLVRAEFGPKIYVVVHLVESNEWNKIIMSEFYTAGELINVKAKGYCPKANYKWILEIVNNGHAPATDVKLTFSLTAYYNEIVLESDGVGIKNFCPKELRNVEKEIVVEYLPPDSSHKETIMYMGTFPYVQCQIKQLKSSERSFISKLTKIAYFKHPEFDSLCDNAHLWRLLGL